MARQGCDVVDHGWRWLDYHETIQRLTGTRPIGWYIGTPSANTRQNIGARRRARREGEASATIQRGCPAQVSGGAGGGSLFRRVAGLRSRLIPECASGRCSARLVGSITWLKERSFTIRSALQGATATWLSSPPARSHRTLAASRPWSLTNGTARA